MKDIKHTSGPWRAETVHGHEGNLVYCRIVSDNFEHPGGIAYTSIPLKGKTKKQKELAGLYASQGQKLAQYNAKLIAAAPDLLEALEEALPGIEELNGEFQEGWDSTIKKIKAAIFKAKGL